MCVPGRMRARNRVWSLLADVRSWRDLGAVGRSQRRGGATRSEKFAGCGPDVSRPRERVIAFEPPLRYAYEILSGLPIRGYVAEVMLSPITGGGTDSHWRSSFQAKIPGTGWIIQRLVRRTISNGASALGREADGRS